MAKKLSAKCPHGKPVGIVHVQVCKLGPWDRRDGLWALFVDVFGGGSYSIAHGTKQEMQRLMKRCLAKLRGNCEPAKFVCGIVRDLVPKE